MIQFNLLPDVKLEYIKTKRRKRLIISTSTLIMSGCAVVLVLLFLAVNVLQKQHLNALSKDIDKQVKALRDTPNLDAILTVQNQLSALGGLHDQKPVASRLFPYLTQTTPTEIALTKLDIDFEQSTIKLSGTSDNLTTINKYVDTLKFTDFTVDDAQPTRAFSSVVLSSFGRNQTGATFVIDLNFEAAIFDSSQNVALVVPKTVTTRSETEKPLFEAGEETE